MEMRSVASDDRPDSGPPLWSIGLVVSLMLIVPIVLYSIAPTGPLRDGDTVFSNGQNHVTLAKPLLYEQTRYGGTCLLDPQSPLILLQRPSDRSDGSMVAQVQGRSTAEWPFCPPQAEVILTEHQIVQKSDGLTRTIQNLLGYVTKR